MMVERSTAFRYAKSIGFSPPRYGCHRSGFAIRTSTNTRNAAMNISSPTTSTDQRRRTKSLISSHLNASTPSDTAAISTTANAMDSRENAIHCKLASSHTTSPISNIPSALPSR